MVNVLTLVSCLRLACRSLVACWSRSCSCLEIGTWPFEGLRTCAFLASHRLKVLASAGSGIGWVYHRVKVPRLRLSGAARTYASTFRCCHRLGLPSGEGFGRHRLKASAVPWTEGPSISFRCRYHRLKASLVLKVLSVLADLADLADLALGTGRPCFGWTASWRSWRC